METSSPWNGVSLGDAGPYSDSEWWNLWKHIIGHGANRPNSGVIRGNGIYTAADGDTESLYVVNTSPGSAAVNLRPGSALVDGTAYINDSPLTLSIAANASGNPRIDTIILRKVNALQTVRAHVLQGTPAATPVPTALTQNAGVQWEIPIAYVTAPSGFVTITSANIVQTNEVANGNNIDIVDYVTNNSAITLEPGMVVVWQNGGNRAVTTTTTPYDRNIAGVWTGRTAPGSRGRLQVGGLANVKLTATPSNGQFVVTSTTAGSGMGVSFEGVPNIGRVVLTTIAPDQSQVQLNPDVGNDVATIANARLSAVGANLDTGVFVPYLNGIEVEFYLRSETAAALDNFLIRFGDSSALDTTITNYYSYVLQGSGTGPTMAAIENLGAVAGIRIAGPGATAGANLFVYGRLTIWDVRSTATRKKMVTGTAYFRTGNSTGNLAIATIGGHWENATIRLEQIRILTVSGANLSADSQIVVRAIRSMALP